MIVCSIFFLVIPLSHQNLRSLLLLGNKCDQTETSIQCAEWSQFMVGYFFWQPDLVYWGFMLLLSNISHSGHQYLNLKWTLSLNLERHTQLVRCWNLLLNTTCDLKVSCCQHRCICFIITNSLFTLSCLVHVGSVTTTAGHWMPACLLLQCFIMFICSVA